MPGAQNQNVNWEGSVVTRALNRQLSLKQRAVCKNWVTAITTVQRFIFLFYDYFAHCSYFNLVNLFVLYTSSWSSLLFLFFLVAFLTVFSFGSFLLVLHDYATLSFGVSCMTGSSLPLYPSFPLLVVLQEMGRFLDTYKLPKLKQQ